MGLRRFAVHPPRDCAVSARESAIPAEQICRRESGGDLPPPIFFGKENAPRPVEKKLFLFLVLVRGTIGRAKASLRSRPLGRWARKIAVLSVVPAPNTGSYSGAPSLGRIFGD